MAPAAGLEVAQGITRAGLERTPCPPSPVSAPRWHSHLLAGHSTVSLQALPFRCHRGVGGGEVASGPCRAEIRDPPRAFGGLNIGLLRSWLAIHRVPGPRPPHQAPAQFSVSKQARRSRGTRLSSPEARLAWVCGWPPTAPFPCCWPPGFAFCGVSFSEATPPPASRAVPGTSTVDLRPGPFRSAFTPSLLPPCPPGRTLPPVPALNINQYLAPSS